MSDSACRINKFRTLPFVQTHSKYVLNLFAARSTQNLFEFPAHLAFNGSLHQQRRSGKGDHNVYGRLLRFDSSCQGKSQNFEGKIERVGSRPRFLEVADRICLLVFNFRLLLFQPLGGFRLRELMSNDNVQCRHRKKGEEVGNFKRPPFYQMSNVVSRGLECRRIPEKLSISRTDCAASALYFPYFAYFNVLQQSAGVFLDFSGFFPKPVWQ